MRIRRPHPTAGAGRLLRAEHGFAVPTVLFMLLGAFTVVSIAVVASINAQSGVVRDQRTKSALTAAEAGVSQALIRYNSDLGPPSNQPCLQPSGSSLVAASTQAGTNAGWCQAVSGTSGAGSYSYSIKPTPSTGTLEIVSTGSFSGVTRRVDVFAKSSSGTQVFLDAAVKSQTNITVASNSTIKAGTAAGGDISIASNSAQCGAASVGLGHHLTTAGANGYFQNTNCTTALDPASVLQQNLTLPPVNQGDAATNNDNQRITNAARGSGSPTDLVSGNRGDISWSATTRQLTVDHNTSLTLTGQTYSLCKLTLLQNSSLYIAASQSVRIYFDSPEACNLPVDQASNPELGTTQMTLDSNSRVTSSTLNPASIAFLFVGSQARRTNIALNSNTLANGSCVQNFVVYAPFTNIDVRSNATGNNAIKYCGAIAGNAINLNSNVEFDTDSLSQGYTLPGTAPHYVTSRFVECSAAATSPPNTGC